MTRIRLTVARSNGTLLRRMPATQKSSLRTSTRQALQNPRSPLSDPTSSRTLPICWAPARTARSLSLTTHGSAFCSKRSQTTLKLFSTCSLTLTKRICFARCRQIRQFACGDRPTTTRLLWRVKWGKRSCKYSTLLRRTLFRSSNSVLSCVARGTHGITLRWLWWGRPRGKV